MPVKPVVPLNTAIGFLLGLMLSTGIVFLLEYLDKTLKTEEDIEKYVAVSVLANIPLVKKKN
jgi:capsular polysaccharide biosynthesis protein